MKKTVAVIFGGRSVEHDVSIITAYNPIIPSLNLTEKFNVLPIYISKDGSWFSEKSMNNIDFFKQRDFGKQLKSKIRLSFDGGLTIIWPGLKNKKTKVDLVFPAMHGTFGEDGSLMGLIRMANVPFVGCDISSSVISMDKVLTKQILSISGISTVPYIYFTNKEWDLRKDSIIKDINIKYPLFVKPAHLGSSIGIAKVNREVDLQNAIEVAFHYDDKVLVEESIENLIELTVPVMGNDNLTLGAIERPLNREDFFSFNDKYLRKNNLNYSEIPAKIDHELSEKTKNLAKQSYKAIGCSGIARIDFLSNSKKEIYVNEINTLPGSLYSHNWRKIGISNVDLVTKLIELAEQKFNERKEIRYTFNSNILKNFGGQKK
jgi:D-alanine-D-alanine ligase